MEFTQYTLPNGIRCIHKQVRSSVVYCALTINTGSRDELPREHGLAHLLEHALFKGTKHRKAFHINNRLENLGGELNAYTTKEETVIHTTTLRSDLNKAAELIADVVFHSTFPQKELEKEKEVILDEINSYKDSPSERIYDDFEDFIFKGSSLGHNILGRKSSLMKFGHDDLMRFVERTYNTDQMVFSMVGNITENRFIEVCNRYFAEIPSSPRQFERLAPGPYVPFQESLHRSAYQAHCIIGNRAYHLNDPKRATLSLLTNLLGGPSSNSLLNMEIRERNGLSYTIEAGFTPYSDTGLSMIYFGTDKEKVDLCIELIHKELQNITHQSMSTLKLNMAKKQFIGQMIIAMEGNEGYMLGAARSYLYYNTVDSLDAIKQKILSVTPEEIMEVADEIFGNNLSTLIYK